MRATGHGCAAEVMVWVGAETAPSAAEWGSYMEEIRRGASQRVQARRPLRVLVVAGSAGPDGLQRQQAIDSARGERVRSAVISSSRLARGIVTVFSWFNFDMRCFSPREARAAFDFLGIGPSEVSAVWSEVVRVGKTLQGPVTAIHEVEAALPELSGGSTPPTRSLRL